MVIEVGKPDYYVVLKKRRKTVAAFLAINDIDSRKKLETLIQNLEKEHLISDTFRKEAEQYLAEHKSKAKPIKDSKEVETTTTKASSDKELAPEEKKRQEQEDEQDKSVQKPKRRSKRSTKKSKPSPSEKSNDDKSLSDK